MSFVLINVYIITVCNNYIMLRGSGVLRKNNVWNTSSTNDCKPMQGGALFFYTQPATSSGSADVVISSRQVVIGPLDPRNVTLEPHPPVTTAQVPTTEDNTPSEAENKALERISSDPRISGILTLVKNVISMAIHNLCMHNMTFCKVLLFTYIN